MITRKLDEREQRIAKILADFVTNVWRPKYREWKNEVSDQPSNAINQETECLSRMKKIKSKPPLSLT